jgi:hypothetical protein
LLFAVVVVVVVVEDLSRSSRGWCLELYSRAENETRRDIEVSADELKDEDEDDGDGGGGKERVRGGRVTIVVIFAHPEIPELKADLRVWNWDRGWDQDQSEARNCLGCCG